MDLGLNGRRALVLGASRGLGAAVASLLAAEGADVVAGSRSGAASWASQLPPAAAARVTPHRIDVSDRAALRSTVTALLQDAPFDILIANSGGPPPGKVQTVEAATWDTQFAAMATNLFEVAGLVLPSMIERGWAGSSRSRPPAWSSPFPISAFPTRCAPPLSDGPRRSRRRWHAMASP